LFHTTPQQDRVVSIIAVAVGILAIVARAGRMFSPQADNLDRIALIGSVVLIVVGVTKAARGRWKDGAIFFLAEALLTLFVFIRIDVPIVQSAAHYLTRTAGLPLLAAYERAHGHTEEAGWESILSRDPEASARLERDIAGDPRDVVDAGGCATYIDDYNRYITTSTDFAGNTQAFDRIYAPCEATIGDFNGAMHTYLSTNRNDPVNAAIFAFMDGKNDVADRFIPQINANPTARRRLCTEWARAHVARINPPPGAAALELGNAAHCSS
jgi:hypothetical protein